MVNEVPGSPLGEDEDTPPETMAPAPQRLGPSQTTGMPMPVIPDEDPESSRPMNVLPEGEAGLPAEGDKEWPLATAAEEDAETSLEDPQLEDTEVEDPPTPEEDAFWDDLPDPWDDIEGRSPTFWDI